ncbi:Ankyrin repeat family protein [Thalictrum thalictroides]|uniref:Ankyrin repeat family protein n=1 Tax=Thalictrum thalictroides TaxID=46969 RepID=A0A7J6WD41_THATH|nr:Ankyrin repeat family protein [Thalictrum thalictroides]
MDSVALFRDHVVSVQPDEYEVMIELQAKYSETENSIFEEDDDDYTWTKPFTTAMERDDWKSFKNLFEVLPRAGERKVNHERETLLHLAVRSRKEVFVLELVNLMVSKDLMLKDKDGYTALSLVAISGTKDMAEAMVEKNKHLVLVRTKVINDYEELTAKNNNELLLEGFKVSKGDVELPVVTAARNENTDVALYLYSETPIEELSPDKGKDGVNLLTQLIALDLFDIALDLLHRLPQLCITDDKDGRNAISVLARKPSAFPSGRRHGLWQQYKSILGIKIRKTKSEIHALELLEKICAQVSKMDEKQLKAAGVYQAVLDAAKFGIVEIVYKLMKYNRHLENCKDEDGKSTFLYAIIYRQEKVFNLVQDMRNKKTPFCYVGKKDGNNVLHQVALLDRFSRIDRISGVHLQMQSELQWFEEVEKLVPPKFKDELNHQGMTPRDLFTEQHRPLVEKGEKWLKETSNACTIIAALIATVMVTAAYTIPGGNDSKGHPVFQTSDLFLFFVIMNALSLFASCSSMLIFLGITTSRYTEQDFLRSLPTKLVFALITLFLSIGTMMAAFCATLFIVLRGHNHWVPIAGSSLALPVSLLFLLLQFPHLIDMIYRTYGPGVFVKKNLGIHI